MRRWLPFLVLAACSGDATSEQAALLVSKACAPDQIFCDEVSGTPRSHPPSAYLGPREDKQVLFERTGSATRWSVRIVVPIDHREPQATYVDVTVRGRVFRIVNYQTPAPLKHVTHATVLDAGRHALDKITVLETLEIDLAGGPKLGGGGLSIVESATQTTAAHAPFNPGLTAVPGTCREKALVRFGPIPWNMPALHFPEIEDCSAERCISITEGWIRGHHHIWRLTQMYAVMSNADSLYRSFLWGQPALDWNLEPVGLTGSSTSPRFYFGEYNDDRFFASREAVWMLMDVFVKARTIGSKVHLRCNDCSYYGYHSLIGWLNVCTPAFNDSAGIYANDQDAVTHTVMHEAAHWLMIDMDAGPRALRDTIIHGHGSSCLPLKSTYVDNLDEVRHLATYVAADHGHCSHQNLAVQTIEAYSNFAMRIGEGVRDGELYRWPKFADPTPQPPECVGGEGCLCEDVVQGGQPMFPDGDWSIEHHCSDNDGEMACVETEVNAGAIVGICTRCEPDRGIGCECDFQRPCDVGTCWGDDTYGGGVGHCYDNPPSWACLADCDRLFPNEGGFCDNDHLGGARCMDSSCPDPIATPCYEQGKICRDGQCIVECESTAGCAALGYPSYFECSTAGRCEYPF